MKLVNQECLLYVKQSNLMVYSIGTVGIATRTQICKLETIQFATCRDASVNVYRLRNVREHSGNVFQGWLQAVSTFLLNNDTGRRRSCDDGAERIIRIRPER